MPPRGDWPEKSKSPIWDWGGGPPLTQVVTKLGRSEPGRAIRSAPGHRRKLIEEMEPINTQKERRGGDWVPSRSLFMQLFLQICEQPPTLPTNPPLLLRWQFRLGVCSFLMTAGSNSSNGIKKHLVQWYARHRHLMYAGKLKGNFFKHLDCRKQKRDF